AKSPPPCGPLEQPHTSDKLVKKPLGENRREHEKCAASDRHPVWNFRTSLALFGAVPDQDAHREHTSSEGHPHEKLESGRGRKPQRQCCRELDVTAAHHAGVEGASEHNENDCAHS